MCVRRPGRCGAAARAGRSPWRIGRSESPGPRTRPRAPGPRLAGEVVRKQAEDALCRLLLLLDLGGPSLEVVDRNVPSVDLHDVVDEQHLHDSLAIDGFVRVLGEHHRRERGLPAVLRAVLAAVRSNHVRASEDALQLVELDDELDLPLETLSLMGHRETCSLTFAPCLPPPPGSPARVPRGCER